MAMTNEQWDMYCRNLTTLREFYERPEIRELFDETPVIWGRNDGAIQFTYYLGVSTNPRETMIKLSRILGDVDKSYLNDQFTLTHHLGDGITFIVSCSRGEVCTKRVVGKEIRKGWTVPDTEVEVVEWDCHPLLENENK